MKKPIIAMLCIALCAEPLHADSLMPIWTNDNVAKTLSFNDSFGHNVVVGSYNSGTGVWSPGSISVGATFTGGLVSISGSPITGTGTFGFTVAGTSGGIPYFDSATSWVSSALLAANQIMLGKGAAAAPATLGSLGTITQVLHGNAAGAPSFGAIVTADIATALTTPGPIGGTTPDTGAFTTLSATSTVSGAGFTARFASPGPIGSTSASTAIFTTIVGALVGITDGSVAAAGNVGELKSASVASGAAVSMTTNVAKDITTLSLTAGVWQCSGAESDVVGGTTVTQGIIGSIGTTLNTISTADSGDPYGGFAAAAAGAGSNFGLSTGEFNVSGTTTVHLVMQAFFTTSTLSGYGTVRCKRTR